MPVRWKRLGTHFVLVCSVSTMGAQSTAPTLSDNRTGQPPSLREVLAEHGITRREQVVQALSSADPKLRSDAAMRLEEINDQDAPKLIRVALSTEQNPVVAVSFASALWALGDVEGQARLEAFCLKAPTQDILMRATENLSLRHKGGLCTQALIDFYRKSLSSGQLLVILSLLQAIASDASPEDRILMSRLADEESRSADLHVRVEARHLSRELRR